MSDKLYFEIPLNQWSPTFLAPGTGSVEDNFSTDRVGGDGSGGNSSDVEQWGVAGEASLVHLPLTSCCVALFLTGHGPVLVCRPGVEDPCPKLTITSFCYFQTILCFSFTPISFLYIYQYIHFMLKRDIIFPAYEKSIQIK